MPVEVPIVGRTEVVGIGMVETEIVTAEAVFACRTEVVVINMTEIEVSVDETVGTVIVGMDFCQNDLVEIVILNQRFCILKCNFIIFRLCYTWCF